MAFPRGFDLRIASRLTVGLACLVLAACSSARRLDGVADNAGDGAAGSAGDVATASGGSGLAGSAGESDAARSSDAADASFDNPDASSEPGAPPECVPLFPPQIHELGLSDAYHAAISACHGSHSEVDCEDGSCPRFWLLCGTHRMDFDADGCLARFVASMVDEVFAAEVSRCMVEQMAGACTICAADATVEYSEGCTD